MKVGLFKSWLFHGLNTDSVLRHNGAGTQLLASNEHFING